MELPESKLQKDSYTDANLVGDPWVSCICASGDPVIGGLALSHVC